MVVECCLWSMAAVRIRGQSAVGTGSEGVAGVEAEFTDGETGRAAGAVAVSREGVRKHRGRRCRLGQFFVDSRRQLD